MSVDEVSLSEALAIQALAWPDSWANQLGLKVESQFFNITGREYQRAILRDESQIIVCPKGAQLGLTTVFLVKTCHSIVQRGWSALYLLPLKAGSISFVQRKIDPMIDSNPVLAKEFMRVDNRNQKVTLNGGAWTIRGTNIHSELREISADLLVLDERDVMVEENLDDAYARLHGSSVQRAYELSTPTIDGHGVYGEDGWAASDQMQWWVPCPGCGSMQVLSWEENILPFIGDTIEESHTSCRCSHCKRPWKDEERAAANARGVWVPLNPGGQIRGYHLSQLNSPTMSLCDRRMGILVNWFRGQTDSGKLRSFYNLSLGLPYAAPGDKFTAEMLDSARGDYVSGVIANGQLCIGIDQGQEVLHVTIWSQADKKRRLLRAFTVRADKTRTKWQVLDEDVLQAYSSWIAVCDAHPDKEDCETLSKKYSGRFFMGFEKDRPEQEETAKFQASVWGEPAKVVIDRTMAFDSYIKGYVDGNVILPKDARELGEQMPRKGYGGFYHQHLQMVRIEQEDTAGRTVARWVNGTLRKGGKQTAKSGNRPDHFHHSSMFALVAGMKDAPLVVSAATGDLFRKAGGIIASRR